MENSTEMPATGVHPLISCVCITKNDQALLARAVACFQAQSYPNKELIIVYESNNTHTGAYIRQLSAPDVITHEVDISLGLTLGDLRNMSIGLSRGEYFCQWDDDDWYHQDRLACQMDLLLKSGKPAAMLVFWTVYDAKSNCTYRSALRPWEGSILCKKSIIKGALKYSSWKKGEDNYLMKKLMKRKLIYPVVMPNLYIYVYHGNNTFDHKHFSKIFNHSLKLPKYHNKAVEKILSGAYSVQQASRIMSSPKFLEKMDYFG
jgi:glycosyltransferase involved in cell wall biosynthesis